MGLKRRWSIRIGILSRLMATVRLAGRFLLSSHRLRFTFVTLAMLLTFTAGLGVLSGRVRGLFFVPRLACFIRSEEHTSELQSRFDVVCRLLLEEKTS